MGNKPLHDNINSLGQLVMGCHATGFRHPFFTSLITFLAPAVEGAAPLSGGGGGQSSGGGGQQPLAQCKLTLALQALAA